MVYKKASGKKLTQMNRSWLLAIIFVVGFIGGLLASDTTVGTSMKKLLMLEEVLAYPKAKSNPAPGQEDRGPLNFAEHCYAGVSEGPPYVTITTPTDGQIFAPGTTIPIQTQISDGRTESSGTYAVVYVNDVWAFWGMSYTYTLPKKPSSTYVIKAAYWKTLGNGNDGCVIDTVTIHTSSK